MKNLQNYLVEEGEAKLKVLPTYMDINFVVPFQEFVYQKSIEWNKEAIGLWNFYDIGQTFLMIPNEEKIYTAKTCWSEVETDALTFGVSISIYCLNIFAWILSDELNRNNFDPITKARFETGIKSFSEQFYFARDFVIEDDNELEGLDISTMLNILD